MTSQTVQPNDSLAGVPVVVTYSPIYSSGIAFERTVSRETTTFEF